MPTRRMSMAGSLRVAAFAEAGYRIHSAFVKGSAPAPSFLLTNELEKVLLLFMSLARHDARAMMHLHLSKTVLSKDS